MMTTPLVGIVMGSASDWPVMLHAANRLAAFGVPCESRVISAHRSPALAHEYAATAEKRGLTCIIAAAGGAAHLAGVMAAGTSMSDSTPPRLSASANRRVYFTRSCAEPPSR